jgi:ribosomal protein S18 acetylase RimI-like enzyme
MEQEYVIVREAPSVEEYLHLRAAAGLSPKTEEAAALGLGGGVHSVTVRLNQEAVGMGRIIGDGGCFLQIVDIAVLPAHQKRGLGRLIMEALTEFLERSVPSSAYVSLIAEPGTTDFYERFGFKVCDPLTGMYRRIERV